MFKLLRKALKIVNDCKSKLLQTSTKIVSVDNLSTDDQLLHTNPPKNTLGVFKSPQKTPTKTPNRDACVTPKLGVFVTPKNAKNNHNNHRISAKKRLTYSPALIEKKQVELINFLREKTPNELGITTPILNSQVIEKLEITPNFYRRLVHRIHKQLGVTSTSSRDGKNYARIFKFPEKHNPGPERASAELGGDDLGVFSGVFSPQIPSRAHNARPARGFVCCCYNKNKINNITTTQGNISYAWGAREGNASKNIENQSLATKTAKKSGAESPQLSTPSPSNPSLPRLQWKLVDTNPLAHLGLTQASLQCLRQVNTPDAVQESILHFAYSLQHGPRIKKYPDPLRVLMGVLRKGDQWVEPRYLAAQAAEKKRKEQQLAQTQKIAAQQFEKMLDHRLALEFPAWRNALTEIDLQKMLPTTLPTGRFKNAATTSFLKNYFRKHVLIPALEAQQSDEEKNEKNSSY